MTSEFVEQREGGWKIRAKRMSLDTLVAYYKAGDSAEVIQETFSFLTLEEVRGAIDFYLANRAEVDQYIGRNEKLFDEMVRPLSETNPALYERLMKAGKEMGLLRG